MLLYIVRHGEPDYVTDTLTTRGRLQAEAVGKRIAAAKIDRIFSSPMGRARETAAPACRLLGLTPTIEEWTHEIEDERLTPFPDGVPKSITTLPNVYFREKGNIDLPYERTFACQGINQSHMQEAFAFIRREGDAFLERLGYREENGVYRILHKNEERVALFCHSAFTKAWLSHLLHVPLHIMWSSFDLTFSAVTVIEMVNRESGFTAPRCLCFSDISHLYAEGLETLHNNRFPI